MSIHTDENDVYIYGSKVDHDHQPNPDLIQTKRLRREMKQRIVNELTPIAVIYEEETAKAPVDRAVLAAFPTNQEIYHTLAANRQKLVPLLPSSYSFDIPDLYELTNNGERFLLLDESRARRDRLLLYGSDVQLNLLFDSQAVYMDGTFSKAPPYFMQVFIIHAIYFDTCVPCVFGLMINKKGTTYRQIFFELKQIAAERHKDFSPQLILTDFESGVLPVFPSSRHYGCNFHFCQAIFRQIQQLGIQQQYIRDEVVRGLCRKIMSLAMMPVDIVLRSYDEIRNDAQQLTGSPIEPLLNYFEKQWLPDINLWNVSTTNSRTNSVCEGYHNRMNHRISRNHPHIWRFIQFVQSEEKNVQTIVLQWSSGATKKQNVRATAKQKRIDTLYQRYNDGLINSSQLLTGLSYLVGNKI
ncbi:unnamed protein product [Rotaria sp. Silwood2]|nr:unnamed protein product [Rotaria sp. Silwood2]CAF3391661.1 unnamed protein product [Rotaria sp. Silwood2]CAF4453344.1 unnamed protein product [Rotaria sp. Silwood2]CAF4625357.1 unnamed protein product [Rotaria sp. Silwood2]